MGVYMVRVPGASVQGNPLTESAKSVNREA